MNIEHRIVPRNENEAMQISAAEVASDILEDILGLEDLTLECQRQPGWAGARAFHAGMYVPERKLIKINFRNLQGHSLKNILVVLGHEFRHAQQHKNGWGRAGFWKGPEVQKCSYVPGHLNASYYNLPEEIDARNFQVQYAEMIIKDPRFAKYQNLAEIKLNGKVLKRKDYNLTLKHMGYEGREKQIQTFRDREDNIFWMSLDQIPGAKKWTKKVCRVAWTMDILKTQPFIYQEVPITIDDLVC